MDHPFLLLTFLALDALFIAGWVLWRFPRAGRAQRRSSAVLPPTAEPGPVPPLPVDQVFFRAEESVLNEAALDAAARLAEYLCAYPQPVILEGSADASGHLAANRRLARGRAEALKRAMISRNVPADLLTATSLEPQHGRTSAEREKWRRVRVMPKVTSAGIVW